MRLGRGGPLIVAAALYLVTGVVNLEVPLYRTYAAAAGWNNGLTAIMFAAYVAGLLPVLLCLGGLSDRVGRKPVVLLGTFVAVVATALMILHPTIQVLLVARLLKGVGVGLSVGAGTAWLAELGPGGDAAAVAANRVAVMTSLGFGSGAIG
ncbi:MAG TPA: MFS transporter, partial [Thermomicrobiales bacterium]